MSVFGSIIGTHLSHSSVSVAHLDHQRAGGGCDLQTEQHHINAGCDANVEHDTGPTPTTGQRSDFECISFT